MGDDPSLNVNGKFARRTFLEQSTAMLLTAGVAASITSAQAQEFQLSPKGSTLRFFPGVGPPLFLLHGFPQAHVEWHRMAPSLSKHFTVVATDLRGYGGSSKP